MGKVRARKETGKLYLDFFYHGVRCREQTALSDTPANRKKVEKLLQRVEAKILLDELDYAEFFPGSRNLKKIQLKSSQANTENIETASGSNPPTVTFSDFAQQWFREIQVEWRQSHIRNVSSMLESSLIPALGSLNVGEITKANILEFRAGLAKRKGRGSKVLRRFMWIWPDRTGGPPGCQSGRSWR